MLCLSRDLAAGALPGPEAGIGVSQSLEEMLLSQLLILTATGAFLRKKSGRHTSANGQKPPTQYRDKRWLPGESKLLQGCGLELFELLQVQLRGRR